MLGFSPLLQAVTESIQVDTLMKYLIDSLQSCESGFGDALNPNRLEAEKSFMGNHKVLGPVTAEEFHLTLTTLEREVTRLGELVTKVDPRQAVPFNHNFVPSHSRERISTSSIPTPNQRVVPSHCCQRITSHSHSPASSFANQPAIPRPPFFPLQSPNEARIGTSYDASVTPLPRLQPALIIPDIKRGPEAWWQMVKQWNEGEPENGLHIPLRDWPELWFTGSNKLLFSSKRNQRKVIAQEFIRCVPCSFRTLGPSLITASIDTALIKPCFYKLGRVLQEAPRN